VLSRHNLLLQFTVVFARKLGRVLVAPLFGVVVYFGTVLIDYALRLLYGLIIRPSFAELLLIPFIAAWHIALVHVWLIVDL
jgi:hypothetical protein